jgi:hypothetical protein
MHFILFYFIYLFFFFWNALAPVLLCLAFFTFFPVLKVPHRRQDPSFCLYYCN